MFAEAVDRVSTISTEKSRAVKLSLKKGSMILSATSPENGSASEELEVGYDGDADRDRLQRPLSPRHHRADPGQRGASSSWPTPPRRRCWAMPRDAIALYVLMPMRV